MPRADESLRRLSEALREISPDEPALVSLRRFDASDARRRLGLPTGRGLRSRFRLGWGRLCTIAVTGGDQAQALNASLRDRAKPPTRTEIHFALRTHHCRWRLAPERRLAIHPLAAIKRAAARRRLFARDCSFARPPRLKSGN